MAEFGDHKPRYIMIAVWAALVLFLFIFGVGAVGGYFHEFDAAQWISKIEDTIAAWGPWGSAVSMGIMA